MSVGYPASVDLVTDLTFTPSFKDGSISSKKTVEGGLLPVYEISAAVSAGMSGGPTVNLNGEVVGINSFGIVGEPQAFNFVRPSSTVIEMMNDLGVSNDFGDINSLYRQGLDAYFAGDKKAAIQAFDLVLDQQPSNELAQEYRRKASDLPDPVAAAAEGGGLPIVPIGVGALVIAAIAAGFMLLQRAKRSSPAGASFGSPPAAPPQTPDPAQRTTSYPPMQPVPDAPPAGATDKFCPTCGHQVELGTPFCGNCGRSFVENRSGDHG